MAAVTTSVHINIISLVLFGGVVGGLSYCTSPKIVAIIFSL